MGFSGINKLKGVKVIHLKVSRLRLSASWRVILSFVLLVALLIGTIVGISRIAHGATTTLLSDSFTGSTIDSAKWTVYDPAGTNVSQNNALRINGSYAGSAWYQSAVSSVDTFNSNGLSISAKLTPGTGSSGALLIAYGDPNFQATGQTFMLDLMGSGNSILALTFDNGTLVNNSSCGSVSDGATYTMTITSTGFDAFKDTGSGPSPLCSMTTSFHPNGKKVFFQSDSNGAASQIDDVLVTGTQTAATEPGQPTSLAASAQNAQVGLSWAVPSSNGGSAITDYKVEYKRSVDSTWLEFSDGTSTATTATVTGLTNGVNYNFRVSAVNIVGAGVVSATVSTIPTVPTVSTPPQNIGVEGGDTQVTVSWIAPASNGNSAVTDYRVDYKLSTDSSWITVNDGVSTALSLIVTGLTNATNYDFRVFAINGVGTSSASSTATTSPTSVLLSDSFTGTTIDSAKWTVYDPSTTNGISQNGSMFIKGSHTNSPDTWRVNSLDSVQNFGNNNLTFSTKITNADAAIIGYGDPDFQHGTAYLLDITGDTNAVYALIWSNGSMAGESNLACGTGVAGGTYKMKITGSGVNFYVNNNLLCSVTTSVKPNNKPIFLQSAASGTATAFDDALVTNVTINAPGAPTSLASTGGSGQMGLSWTAPSTNGGAVISDYLVEYKLSASSSWTTFNDGTSTATTATVTGLTNDLNYDFRVSAINASGTGTASSIVTASPNSATAPLTITSPARTVSSSPSTATLLIHDDDGYDFTIPYIQTANSITVSAGVGSNLMPSGGGIKFVMTGAHTAPITITDNSSPYTANFTNLAKDDYTLDAYVVNASGIVQAGATFHDTATQIGVGDIISAVGDSITECYFGLRTTTHVTDWTLAPSDMVSADNRNFPQYGPTTQQNVGAQNWCAGFEVELSTKLANHYGYPVFIMNEGVGGITGAGTVARMAGATWANREAALHPNKFILHLGTNDTASGISVPSYTASMQTIINTFVNTYGVSGQNIWLADPSFSSVYSGNQLYLPAVASLRSTNNLAGGPDFWTFYGTNTNTWYGGDAVHPNVAGISQMARLWAVSMLTPKNVTTAPITGGARVSWSSLSSVESSITNYKVSYGTSPSNLSTTVNAGNVTSLDITSGLAAGTTYYFAVTGYDNSPTPQPTLRSAVLNSSFTTAPSAPSGLSVTPGVGSAALSWTAPASNGSAITDYVIQYKRSVASTWRTASDGTNTTTTFTIAGLAGLTSYDFRVAAVNGVGTSANSSVVSATTVGVTPVATTSAGASLTNAVIEALPTFTGKANPGSTVVVTVHSDPVTCTTTADADGNWTCTLPSTLPAGTHSAIVSVTPFGGGAAVDYGPYAVTVAGQVITPNTGLKSQNLTLFIAAGVIGIIFLGFAAYTIRRTLKARA